MQSLMVNLNATDSSYHLAKSANVLDAVTWICKSVNLLTSDTILRCFAKAGFIQMHNAWICKSVNLLTSDTILRCFAKAGFIQMHNDESPIREEVQEIVAQISPLYQQNISCDKPEQYISIDVNLTTHYTLNSAADYLDTEERQEEENEKEQIDVNLTTHYTLNSAADYLDTEERQEEENEKEQEEKENGI
ncbi:hypothetical protein QE152_g37181 [Popillia japonica]|uniref:Uncharacterized protein n=1 Tax=Popillia japonica TaxID=7064 RepID=A0AAW1IB88_POPJA